jgi:hypothetical protein
LPLQSKPYALTIGLKSGSINLLTAVFNTYNALDTVLLYDTRAKGIYHAGSDIDITLPSSKAEMNHNCFSPIFSFSVKETDRHYRNINRSMTLKGILNPNTEETLFSEARSPLSLFNG